jgi:ubiquinone/menaquinone biosynthesis C-methylase UbiE
MQDLRLFDVARSSVMAPQILEAYERWAPLYPPVAHNPLMRAEQRAMAALWPDVAGRRALDLACGTGRYSRLLTQSNAREVTAVDFCLPMLVQVSTARRICASMMRLPLVGDAFDVVISGLALGHATAIEPWMTEIARVLDRGGVLLYSDFHPEAARAGLPRSFKDQTGRTFTVPHRCYELKSQLSAAAAAGLTIEAVHEVRVGFELQEPFSQSDEFYRRWHGLPIVLIVRARK